MDKFEGDSRLVIIERQEIVRLGRAAVARRSLGDLWSVSGVDLPDLGSMVDLIGADGNKRGRSSGDRRLVALVVVAADGNGFDRFDAVSAVCTLAGLAPSVRPWVVAAVGDDNPLLSVRLVGGGADRMVSIDDVSSTQPGVFAGAIDPPSGNVGPAGGKLGSPGGAKLGTDPEAVLTYVVRRRLEAAFEPGLSQADIGLSRREILRVRRDIAALGGIQASLDRFTGGRDRRVDLPTWRDVVTYVNCARGELDWGDDAWGNGSGPRIGTARLGVRDLELAARRLVA